MTLSICAIASEVAPLAKTGGLADVAGALTRMLHDGGHDVRLFMPLYASIDRQALALHEVEPLRGLELELGAHRYQFDVYTAQLPASRAVVYLIDCPALYARGNLYTNEPDEHRRFLALTRAALECCRRLQWRPDIVHSHDWHAAFAPLYLKTLFAADPHLGAAKSVLTIHNIGYQGVFDAASVDDLGIDGASRYLEPIDLAAGLINSLKHGVLHADAITTVSPTYAREILTPEFGLGLETVLAARGADLTGILNGVDYAEWDPRWDQHLPLHYGAFQLERKAELKARFLAERGLEPAAGRVPLLGIVSRMTSQKGFDLLRDALPELLASVDVRLAVLGSGEPEYEQIFSTLAAQFPGRALYRNGYDEPLAHWIEAASDLFLMPSRYEPCGLNQMYSLRYGTIPIVRRTGGLADSVTHFDPLTGRGNGVVFNDFDGNAIRWALRTALDWYADPALWEKIVRNAMRADFSWEIQARQYERLFQQLAATTSA
ncbi:MAG TPA: glycogen synthase GlgA [Steroidobacteraceae bacterium]|nr:glycogen synthase GlgA [Steroidobacteraceae bacterium]HRX90210.1 glycogen synthase GlgA [Steroidobacteraceae bacterium]